MRRTLALVAVSLLLADVASATVLCLTKSGTLKARVACRKKETPTDAAALGLESVCSCDLPSESLTMPPCGTPAKLTSTAYSGRLQVTVSGTQEETPGNPHQDAFYRLVLGNLSVATGPDPDAVRIAPESHGNCTCHIKCQPNARLADFIVGSYPAFNPAHIYTVEVDLSSYVAAPTRLYFGSWDCGCGDNSGGFAVTLRQLP